MCSNWERKAVNTSKNPRTEENMGSPYKNSKAYAFPHAQKNERRCWGDWHLLKTKTLTCLSWLTHTRLSFLTPSSFLNPGYKPKNWLQMRFPWALPQMWWVCLSGSQNSGNLLLQRPYPRNKQMEEKWGKALHFHAFSTCTILHLHTSPKLHCLDFLMGLYCIGMIDQTSGTQTPISVPLPSPEISPTL